MAYLAVEDSARQFLEENAKYRAELLGFLQQLG
jgi:hypothetical protein